MSIQKPGKVSGSSLAIALGAELVVYALVMALFMVEAGWFLLVEVVIALGLVFLLKRKPELSIRLQKRIQRI